MQLQNYPLDSQWCHLRILSYAYDVEQLTISWIPKDPITRNPNITLSDMHIVKLVPGLCDGNYSTGSWSCVTAEFFVTREITHHIRNICKAVPARVSLAITTLLTLSTQANSVRNSLPEVSYMKSLDLFLAITTIAAAVTKVPDDKNTESMCDSFDYCSVGSGYNVAAAGSQEDPNNNNTANCSIPTVPLKSVEPSADTAKSNDYSVHQMDYGHTAIDLDMPLEETMTFNNSASPSSISWNESVSNGRVQNNNNNTGSNVRPRLFTAISQKKIAAKGDSTNSLFHYPNTLPQTPVSHNKDCAEWRDRGAERLANWTKTELSSDELAETLQSTPNYNHWPKLNLSLPTIAKSEESDLNESTSPRFSSKLALSFPTEVGRSSSSNSSNNSKNSKDKICGWALPEGSAEYSLDILNGLE
uniref:Neurotransmitter-gated ion-channel ligand-binding domain-containing protein n=1 Tax=Ditylenchus dipsaci TaxID=166011 RepID=A0A915D129_9BILA